MHHIPNGNCVERGGVKGHNQSYHLSKSQPYRFYFSMYFKNYKNHCGITKHLLVTIVKARVTCSQ